MIQTINNKITINPNKYTYNDEHNIRRTFLVRSTKLRDYKQLQSSIIDQDEQCFVQSDVQDTKCPQIVKISDNFYRILNTSNPEKSIVQKNECNSQVSVKDLNLEQTKQEQQNIEKIKELKERNKELEETVEFYRSQQLKNQSCGTAGTQENFSAIYNEEPYYSNHFSNEVTQKIDETLQKQQSIKRIIIQNPSLFIEKYDNIQQYLQEKIQLKQQQIQDEQNSIEKEKMISTIVKQEKNKQQLENLYLYSSKQPSKSNVRSSQKSNEQQQEIYDPDILQLSSKPYNDEEIQRNLSQGKNIFFGNQQKDDDQQQLVSIQDQIEQETQNQRKFQSMVNLSQKFNSISSNIDEDDIEQYKQILNNTQQNKYTKSQYNIKPNYMSNNFNGQNQQYPKKINLYENNNQYQYNFTKDDIDKLTTKEDFQNWFKELDKKIALKYQQENCFHDE